MKFSYLLIISVITLGLQEAHAKANRLTCDVIDDVMLFTGEANPQSLCDIAQRLCKGLKILQKRPVEDTFRKQVEPGLLNETQHQLDICEIAIRDVQPDYLTPR